MSRPADTDPFAALRALRDTLPGGDVPPGADENVQGESSGNTGTDHTIRKSGADTTESTRKPAVSIFYERKGRHGKEATIIAGLDSLSDDDLACLASTLKRRLGTGGSARGGEILLQGDRRDEVRRILDTLGYR